MKRKGVIGSEFLIIVSILSLLGSINIPSFINRQDKAKTVLSKTEIETNLKIALDLYELDNGSYPTTQQGLRALLKKPVVTPIPADWRGPYCNEEDFIRDPWGKPYNYSCPGKHNKTRYDLSSNGPDGQSGTNDDITNWKEGK
ncbi:MAG: type II secretion system major pseudopilin GspG [Candidatus Theseobacter exili]|nr:type II secretion system major pseudopilin GspG [Candidatus Theseobacter exili]